jgi:hypothetical protein
MSGSARRRRSRLSDEDRDGSVEPYAPWVSKADGVATMSVWHWSGRDRISLHDLEYLVAAPSRREWRLVVVRLQLPGWKDAGTLKAADRRFEVAAAAPGRVFWRDQDQGTSWQDEAALEILRRTSTVRELSAGRYADPVHRPGQG